MVEAPSWSDFVGAFSLFRDPILCAIVAGTALGYLSVFIVVRRMVFVAATLSQAAALGVAAAFFAEIHVGLHLPPLLGAVLASLLAAALANLPAHRIHLSPNSLLALIWIVSAGGAVLLGDRIAQEAHDIAAILFGTAVLVRLQDLVAVSIAAALALLLGIWWRHAFVFTSFDREGAQVRGLPVRLIEHTFSIAVAVLVAVATRALGALPVFAFTVLPGIAALLLGGRLSVALIIAPLLGAIAGGGGYMFAFFQNFPVGGSQTFVAALFGLLGLVWAAVRRID